MQPLTREERYRAGFQAPIAPNSTNPFRSGGFSMMGESVEAQQFSTNYKNVKMVP